MAARPTDTTQTVAVDVDEEQIVDELGRLGVSYLSRQTTTPGSPLVAPLERSDLLAAMQRQPSARVRVATIALLLAQPSSWRAVEGALSQMLPRDRLNLILFYSAAVQLQRLHQSVLRARLGAHWELLPDRYAEELEIGDAGSPQARLTELAQVHRSRTGSQLNWEGTYRQAADRLLRRWALEARWSR